MSFRSPLNRPVQTLISWLDGADRATRKPFPGLPMLPYDQSRRFGWTHYGVMIPDLPAPHHFFTIMSVLGTPGALAFDVDHVRRTSPRHNATVVSGTASSHPQHFGSYDMQRDCHLTNDGSLIRLGREIVIEGAYPEYRVRARYGEFALDLHISNTAQVSWFVKNPVYDHFSLLSRYVGDLTWQGEVLAVEGLCTFEYARCFSPYLLRDRALPAALKVPLDFFCYNIINLDASTQLLLCMACIKGVPVQRAAYLRSLQGESQVWHDVDLEFLHWREEEQCAADGQRMRLPAAYRWQVQHQGRDLLVIHATPDTPFTYGLGNGYAGGFAYTGEYAGRAVQGRGYIEFIDLRKSSN